MVKMLNKLKHIAIIMDGNGRWAASKHQPRVAGHKRGAEIAKEIVERCAQLEVPYLTLFAFSSENWKRPKNEVVDLITLLIFYLESSIEALISKGICLRVIGDISKFSADVQLKINRCEELTRNGSRLQLIIALNYGSKQEIVDASRRLAFDVQQGSCDINDINESTFEKYLYTAGIPDPDLLIRTSGEQRISNFLLWQLAYTELYFTKLLWPDFTVEALDDAIDSYLKRERRYGSA
jgi:undecaprenyl diphosphate synthase